MKTRMLGLLLAAGMPAVSVADVVGFEVGAGIWNHQPSGDIAIGENSADLEDDFDLSAKSELVIWASLEHPVPLIPNVKVKKTTVTSDGSGNIQGDIVLDGVSFSADEDVDSELDLSQLDMSLYYEILDNWVNLDVGLTIRKVTGNLFVETTDGSSSVDQSFDVVLPMLYGAARFDLPFSGFRVGVEANVISFDGNKFTDLSLFGAYESEMGLGAQLGYRIENITLEDVDDVDADITLDGVTASVYYHF